MHIFFLDHIFLQKKMISKIPRKIKIEENIVPFWSNDQAENSWDFVPFIHLFKQNYCYDNSDGALGPHQVLLRVYTWPYAQISLLMKLRDLYGMLVIKVGLVMYQDNTLHTVLSFLPWNNIVKVIPTFQIQNAVLSMSTPEEFTCFLKRRLGRKKK